MRWSLIVIAAVFAFAAACGQNPPLKCSAANCMGCCTGAGDCLGGTTFFDCGKAGAICATCDLGQACVGGGCAVAPPDAGCGLASCGGCCDTHHVCRTGADDTACGTHANACVDCNDAGLGCDMHACI